MNCCAICWIADVHDADPANHETYLSTGLLITSIMGEKMKINLNVLLLFFLTSSGYVFASHPEKCIETAMTQVAMNKCSGINYKAADDELNRVYKKIKVIYQEDKIFLVKLQAAQKTWIKLRDADFEMKYPHADQPRYYGSIFPSCANEFKIQLTLQRIEFLKLWLVGSEEGDVCSGSIMNKFSIGEISGN